ncbi:sigma-70 family RNA polymerase sigma factor [Tissierella sp. Yu-01]|uniref:RNA polymerase sigma factor n=1 Tax=Tissierella sp. Yu-01 TaxID=3035694 RepID=UPI00240D8B4B|nr:sigma-70 family RNA polymerase sigma factor [Tissierella sp. Yu-01]WFA09106.1 sigma-70 family RNA polymerase sigma factor [Tissierella sp. Yu-01]
MVHQSVQLTEKEIEQIVDKYGNKLFKICLVILCKAYDAEDAVQETIIKYLIKKPTFNNSEHEKEWMITAAMNCCKNMRKFHFRRPHLEVSELQLYIKNKKIYDLLELLMNLPLKYKTVLLLHYYEGYKVDEVGAILRIPISSVKKLLKCERGMDVNKISNAVNSVEMSKLMKYRILENCNRLEEVNRIYKYKTI